MPNQMLYGFHTLADVAARTVTEVGVEQVSGAVQQAVAEHNRQLDALFGLFITRTTGFKVKYWQAAGTRLQPLDEQGRARPIQIAGSYEVGFPLHKAGTAWGATRKARIKMTVQQVNDLLASMLIADARWVRDHILAALYANAQWTFADDEHGNLTVVGLANGDSVTYQIQSGQDSAATDNHYWGQAASIADANDPYPVIYSELAEHPENNGGQILSLIPTGLKATTQALAGFNRIEDPNILKGANLDRLVGTFGSSVPGQIIGYHDSGVWIAEWPTLAANYIVSVATGGEKPIAMREEPEAELQGFKPVATREDHPFWEQHYEREAGFGAWNRVAATITRIGNGTYAIPAGFDSPMP